MSDQPPARPLNPFPTIQPVYSNNLLGQLQSMARSTLTQSHQTYLSNLQQLRLSANKIEAEKARKHQSPAGPLASGGDKKEKPKTKKLKIGLGRDNFPTIYDAYNIPREKKIKKKKKSKNRSKLIKRFEVDLINISTKIEEEVQKKARHKYVRPTNTKHGYNRNLLKAKKLSKIKKKIQTIKLLTQGGNELALVDPEAVPDLPYQVTKEETQDLRAKQGQMGFRLKKLFNNSPAIKQAYDKSFEVREYIDNVLSKSLDKRVLKFINHVNFSQLLRKRLEPLKYKKRLVYGFNEVTKSLEMTRKEV